jgi:hypothetical protein
MQAKIPEYSDTQVLNYSASLRVSGVVISAKDGGLKLSAQSEPQMYRHPRKLLKSITFSHRSQS